MELNTQLLPEPKFKLPHLGIPTKPTLKPIKPRQQEAKAETPKRTPFEFINSLGKNKTLGQDFAYMRPVSQVLSLLSSSFNPYNLEVVEYQMVDRLDFYTISAMGVTHFTIDATEFTPLQQWIREHDLYHVVVKIPFFAKYRPWKAFVTWRRNVRHMRVVSVRRKLIKNAFILSPIIAQGLLHVSNACDKLRQTCLFQSALKTWTLNEFIEHQKSHVLSCSTALKAFDAEVRRAVTDSCDSALVESKCDKVSIAMAEKNSAPTFHFTRQAARHAECKRLQRLVKLVDYLRISTLHVVVIDSIRSFLLVLLKRDPNTVNSSCTSLHNSNISISYDPNIPDSDENDSCLFPKFTTSMLANAGYEVFCSISRPFISPSAETAAKLIFKQIVESSQPLFKLQIVLLESKVVLVPKPCDFLGLPDSLASQFTAAVDSLPPLINSIDSIRTAQGFEEIDFTEGPTVTALLAENLYFTCILERMRQLLSNNLVRVGKFASTFIVFREMYVSNQKLSFINLDYSMLDKKILLDSPQFCDKEKTIESSQNKHETIAEFFDESLALFSRQIKAVNDIPSLVEIENFFADMESFKLEVLPMPERCFSEIVNILPKLSRVKNEALLNEINDCSSILSSPLHSVESFVENLQKLEAVKESMNDYDARASQITKFYSLIQHYSLKIEPTDLAMFQALNPSMRQLKDAVDLSTEMRDDNVTKFAAELEQNFNELLTKVTEVRQQAQDPILSNPNSPVDKVLDILQNINKKFEELNSVSNVYSSYQSLFKVSATKMPEIDETREIINLNLTLWRSFREWDTLMNEWDHCPFESLQTEEMSAKINSYMKIIYNVEKGLPPNDVVPKLRVMVDSQKSIFSSIVDLRNPALKQRHWDKIQENIARPIVRDESLTLSVLKNSNVFRFKEDISNVSAQASSEAALEDMLQKIIRTWADCEFIVLPYRDAKDVYIIGGVDDIQTLLEDSQATLSTIKASRHIGPIKNEVDKWDRQLTLFSSTLEAWTICQRNWLYLESIFQAPDIQRQLPDEAKMFSVVDRNWKDIMRRTHRHPNAMKSGTTAGTLEILLDSNLKMEKVQKCLEDYLESKRLLFPRFYFLSNDELLEILSQTKNPQAVQPHLGKCFDAIKSLEFSPESKSLDILSMLSPEGEKVAFLKPIKARGSIESWLSNVEEGMVTTIRRLLKCAIQDFTVEQRTRWLLEHHGQIVLTSSQIMWCSMVSKCLMSEDPVGELMHFKQISIANLSQVAAIVRGDLKRLQRAVLGALITIDVHARDILTEMIEAKVDKIDNFGWLKQLRYYWDPENDSCHVKMSDNNFYYGYEYLGCSTRLVITPLTDRCYLTLTGAISMNLGGSPLGPAGTGKTETVKDLAKALARQCVVFNCSDSLDYKMMGKFFAGLAQSGAWCCFDEFNRIDIEVLSVVAQQLLTIKQAKDCSASKFMFEGKEIRLIPSCAAFITMNPGYAGRQELPDNLKALFRPIAMMIPDYGLIAEIMLYSEGFEDAKLLSGKVVTLYKLCSEQLSQQDHYDFGMRAVKSVLVMAGQLKRANPDISENVVLIRSLRDSNLPKFLADDIPLFLGILQDLFPGVCIPDQDFGDLKTQIEKVLVSHNYVVVPSLVNRIIQLYDTTRVRHGVMLVGPSGGGKTTSYQILAESMTVLNELGMDFAKVQLSVLNPKCITMDELYGAVNLATMEWKDGLIGKITRMQVSDASPDEKWTIFDGPVDALWIENMNTVLDDNKLLCLANGERIKLSSNIHMLFEVMDLAVASPATVSRCGMVYMDPSILGWRPYVKKWFFGLDLNADQIEFLRQLFEQSIDPGLEFIRKQKELIPTINLNLVASLCKLFCSLMCEFNFKTASESDWKQIMCYMFIFSYTWSMGGSIRESCHDAFDTFAREIFEQGVSVDCQIPSGYTIYSFFVNFKQRVFVPWEELAKSFVYSDSIPFFELIVPTVDTTRFQYLLHRLLNQCEPCLFVGNSGVGKSVIIQDFLKQNSQIISVFLNFSAQTSSAMTQNYIESKLEKKKKNIMGAPLNKKIAVFVDDLNLPKQDTYGSQPPIELLRQFLDSKGFYDREKLTWKEVEDVCILAACAPPGGGRSAVTPRLIRHFNVLNIPLPSDASLGKIFKSILENFLTPFANDVRGAADSIVNSAVELYNKMCTELLPTPAKSHYTFNLRDLSKVIQGITQISPTSTGTKIGILEVFAHEASRVFHDRLINEADRSLFFGLLEDLISRNFSESISASNLLFGDFIKRGVPHEDRIYTKFEDLSSLEALLDDYLEEYNVTLSRDMRLIFFSDAKQHISRISRIIRQPRGNALLVGVGGTGKKSLTRLACQISEYQCLEIELTRNYGFLEWREDIKKLYRLAGVEGKNSVFLLTDSQIKTELFLEDINGILNTGDVPNLFDVDERETIIGELQKLASEKGYSEDRDSVYQFFIQRVRDNLHIVFATSPVGDSFRNRCRMFPSLVNCCTIDWFDEWPKEALLSVSKRFFEFLEVNDESIKTKLAELCVIVHTSVTKMADKFYAELKRRVYTTPTSYLELISLYLSMLQEKRREVSSARDRLQSGLLKLAETNDVVANMQLTLQKLGPELKEKALDVENLMIKISKDQETADGVKKIVAEEEKIVKEQASQTEAIAAEAQKDLDEALPALEAAYKALDSLEKKDVSEMKAFAKPPDIVITVLEAVCILFKTKPDWESAKKLLSDPSFLKKIQEYDKSTLNDSVIRKIKKYVENPLFSPENVEKVSKAAKPMAMWVIAMDLFYRVTKEVEPKRKRLAEAQASLEETMQKLLEKTQKLRDIEEQLQKLKELHNESIKSKKALTEKMETTTKRLERANKLTTALADEQIRWTASVEIYNQQELQLIGNVFIASACVAYFGAFNHSYRVELINLWVKSCVDLDILVSENFSLDEQLGDAVKIREWNIQGLPSDALSTENALLVTKGRRWPLMIDPQNQANSWIRSMAGAELKVVKFSDAKFLRTIENAVRMGQSVLIEDVMEYLDPAIEPLLLKQTIKQGGRQLIKLGDTLVEYDANFKLFMTTKLPNPHYLPEVCIKVTVINFTVTRDGLEGQLLAETVKLERPELEEQRNSLITSIANDKKMLKDIEEKILKLLYNSRGNILDDEELITALNQSKVTSSAITERLVQAEQTEREINQAREKYRPVALRGSLLYFVVADLSEVDLMYQFSLKYFKSLFRRCIVDSPKSQELQEHIEFLCEDIMYTVFKNVSLGLFEQHKFVFSFMMCVSILLNKEIIDKADWNFFLRGAVVLNQNLPSPGHRCITEAVWKNVCTLAASIEVFKNLNQKITPQSLDWEAYIETDDPYVVPPGYTDVEVTDFKKLLLIKVFHEEKLVPCIRRFVRSYIGEKYIELPPQELKNVYADLNSTTPLVFILSSGSDPNASFMKLASAVGFQDRLHMISLGQGQGPIAEKLIQNAVVSGDWVFLQNCHLAASWMPKLEAIIKDISLECNPTFRLFLSSMPSKIFPTSILQESLKVTNEPPKGLRANLMRSFADISSDKFDVTFAMGKNYRKLCFTLCFFNAIIHERKKFGPLGWNIMYDWSSSDLEVSILVLKNFLSKTNVIPWDALHYLTGEIAFGGRVTDDWDRRTMHTLLKVYYNSMVLEDDYSLSLSGKYLVPLEGDLNYFRSCIEKLPFTEEPSVFGMHENANVSYEVLESKKLIKTCLDVQPRLLSAGTGKSPEETVSELVASILEHLPELEEPKLRTSSDMFKVDESGRMVNSLSTVLCQECARFRKLIFRIKQTLTNLDRAIKGLVVMSAQLELLYHSLLNNQVPQEWANAAYPSLKPLSSWIDDLHLRVKALSQWLEHGQPKSFWIPGFFFPQGFLTGVFQNHARKYNIPIDSLSFRFEVQEQMNVPDYPSDMEDGVLVHGLFIEGARWDFEKHSVQDSFPMEMYSRMPLIRFIPTTDERENCFVCPLYKTSLRAGTLSTTGHSTNFVCSVNLPTEKLPSYWISRGVALLMQNND